MVVLDAAAREPHAADTLTCASTHLGEPVPCCAAGGWREWLQFYGHLHDQRLAMFLFFLFCCSKAGAASYKLMRSLHLPAANRGVCRIAVSQSDAPGSLNNLAVQTGDGDLLLLDRDSFNLTSDSDQPLVNDDAGGSLL